MNEALEFVVRHGALVLFVAVFVEQIGLPVPAAPLLLAAGALVGAGKIGWAAALGAAVVGSVLADLVWFHLGRIGGSRILSLLCRISLEPDSCVRRTEGIFSRWGLRAVVAAKFIPGLSTIMPPLAGIFRVSVRRFLVFDGLGSILYAGCYLLLGRLFSRQLLQVMDALSRVGHAALLLVLGLVATYIGFKYFERQRLRRELRVARISADELRAKQEAGEEAFIVNLRSAADLRNDPVRIPGARFLKWDELDSTRNAIPGDRDVTLYCSCPNEIASARAALLLRKRGIARARPLARGLDGWRQRQYPLEPRAELAVPNKMAASPVEAEPNACQHFSS